MGNKKTKKLKRYFTIWDRQENDYATTAHTDFPIFQLKKNAKLIAKTWNEDFAEKKMYQTDEAVRTGKLKRSRRFAVVEITIDNLDILIK